MLMPLNKLYVVFSFLATLPPLSKARDLNCTEATDIMFGRNEALLLSILAEALFMVDMCNTQPNSVCSLTNVTEGTDVHFRAVVNMNPTEAKDVKDSFKKECENAGGQLILETFDIGLMSNTDDMQYYKIEEENFLPLYDAKYLDLHIVGFLDCVHALECENLTEVSSITKSGFGGFFNSVVYNFTLYDIQSFPAVKNELDLTCFEAAYLLYERSGTALHDSYEAMAAFMMDMCKTQPNNICLLTNVTDAEEADPYLKLTINMNSTEADEVINNLRRECNKAGGRLVFESFDLRLMSTSGEIQYYSFGNEDYEPLYNSPYLDVSIAGYADCFNWTECRNSSDVIEMNIMDWGLLFNASVNNFTLHEVIWDNYTM